MERSRFILALRSFAERWAPAPWRERVLLPTLADLEHECGAVRDRGRRLLVQVRGVWAFLRAFACVSLIASVEHVRRNAWGVTAEDEHLARAVLRRALAATATTLVVLALATWPPIRWLSLDALALTLPSLLSMAVPIGVAFAVALGRAGEGTRRGPATLAFLAGLLTFVLTAWLTPLANQAHRERAVRALAPEWVGDVARGDRELMFHELGARAAELRSAGRARSAAPLDVEWHKKGALAASVLVLALAGAAITSWRLRAGARLLATAGLILLLYGLLRLGEQAADTGQLAPAVAMWGPVMGIAFAAAVLLALSEGLGPAPHPRTRSSA